MNSDHQDQIHAVGDRPLDKRALFKANFIEWLSADVPVNSMKAAMAAALVSSINGKADTVADWGMMGLGFWVGFSIYDAIKRSTQKPQDDSDTSPGASPARKIKV